ncbi:MAG: NHL repeat containing protein [Candidatus Magnetoglobus multicellularis str. Araruama]|uniref:NHL repeat containing protein n=1 Tax=Candidatus Magnetoglobus multicellularis str. Araruama TaxID=890399 RepID=A0A1V1P1G3_9BACT|nr:MAG: NHL repeat containing protein [Candidatus Magnetoglobus multicellularis str. Araruama]
MKAMKYLFPFICISLFISGTAYADSIQKKIHFQGFLTDSNNVAVLDDTYQMTFSLWDGPNDNTATKLWEETDQISVSRGIYSVNLGETTPFPYTLNFAQQYYLGVKVGSENIMKIDGALIPIVSTWHAFRADTVGGRNIKSVSQHYSIEKTDDIVLVTGDITITLPSAVNVPEKWYSIKKMDDETTTVTVATSNGEQINDATSITINKKFNDLSIISNGLQWYSLGISDISGITTTQILDSAITSDKIADGTISGSDIQDSAVDRSQLANGSVIPSKLAGSPENGTSGQTLISKGDGTFDWGGFVTTQGSDSISLDYSFGSGGNEIGMFNEPFNMALDSSGNIYVVDFGNHRVQVFTSSGDYSYSIGSAGSGQGEFSLPKGIAIDSNDRIYVADSNNHRVQIFNTSGEYIDSFGSSGSGQGQMKGPSDLTVDNNGMIYVADTSNHRIQVFTSSGDYSYSIGTGSSGSDPGQFNNPSGIEVDTKGNIYVTDTYNHRVQVFTSSGDYSYSIGSANNSPSADTGEFNQPYDIDVDSNGCIYVADLINARIQVFTSSGVYDYSLTSDLIESPVSVQIHNNKIYVVDIFTNRIIVYRMPGSATYTVDTGNVGIGTTSPTEKLEVDGNVKITNDLILANGTSSVSQTILKAMTQSEARTITLPDASGVVVVTDDGNITISDGSITASKLANNPGNGTSGQALISKGDGTFDWGDAGSGAFTTSEGTASGASLDYSFGSEGSGIGQFDDPLGTAVDSNGNIYVTDSENHRIQVFTASGDYSYSIGAGDLGNGQKEFDSPSGIVIDSNDNIYIADTFNHRIQVLNASGDFSYSLGGSSGSGTDPGLFDRPRGVAVDSNGNIYVVEQGNHRIQVFTAQGNYSYSIGTSGSGPGQFDTPFNIALDNSGNIYVSDKNNHRIQVLTAQGNFSYSIGTGTQGSGTGQFHYPYDVDVDSSGQIYIADSANHRIQVFTASGAYDYSINLQHKPNSFNIYNNKIYITDNFGHILIYNKPTSTSTSTTHTVETGNVGIGTSSPSEKLEVDGNVKISGSIDSGGDIKLPDTNAIYFGDSNTDGKWRLYIDPETNHFSVQQRVGGTWVEKFSVTD